MQEQERIPHLLDSIQLANFQLKDYRNFDDCQYRAPGLQSKTPGKTFQVTYTHNFPQDLLLTHLQIELVHKDSFAQFFQIGEIQASKMTNRGMLGPVIRSKLLKASRDDRIISVPCVSVTQSLKVPLLLKKEFMTANSDILGLKKQKNKQAAEQNVKKMIEHTIKAIRVCGYQLNMNTSAESLVPLLNISQSFKHSHHFDEAAEADILVSLTLISARRFVQAAECLRAVSKFYLQKYIASKSSMDFSRIDKSFMKEQNRQQAELSGFSRTFIAGRVLQGGRYLFKAAKIQLLIADTINQPTLLGQKLEAYNRANCFANGNVSPSKIQAKVDYQETAYNIGPSLIPFLVKVLNDKAQIFKISALKSIQFFYETLGCTLGNFMPIIIKTLITVYPSRKDNSQSGIRSEDYLSERCQSSTRTKLLLDHSNHLLQSLLSLLPGMNKKCLKVMFEEIIQTNLSDQYRNELRLYLLRFGQKIMQICGSDLEIGVPYIRYMLAIGEGKYSIKADANKHINHNLVYFSQRVVDLLKSKILKHYNKIHCLSAIASWLNQTLITLCQNQTIILTPHLQHTLDLVISIYSNPKLTLFTPIEPVIYLLNTSLNEPKLPFDKILQAFMVLVKHGSSDLATQIIERVLSRSKLSTLGLKELKILQKILEAVKQVKIEWLNDFLECIPHSNFDEIYFIFDLLILKCTKDLNKSLISQIINTLFNQYTVKGKAHQQSKQQFVITLLKQLPDSLSLLLDICLFQNLEPQVEDYTSKKGEQKDHCFDSKLFKLHSELFLEKINLLLLVLGKTELVASKLALIFHKETIYKLYLSASRILQKSSNFKIRSKILLLLKHIILLIEQIPKEIAHETNSSKVLFIKVVLCLMKAFISSYKDSKIQYYCLLNIGLIMQKLLIFNPLDKVQSVNLEIMNQEITPNFSLPQPSSFRIQNLIGHQLLAMWNNLLSLLNSPLERVREMLMLVLLQVFKHGLSNFTSTIRQKLIEQFKPLLATCLQSNDSSERLMGVRMLSLILGLGQEYQDVSELQKGIRENLIPFRVFLELILILEDDWSQEVASCSHLIARVCISQELKLALLKKIKTGKRSSAYFDTSNISFHLDEELVEKKPHSFDILNNFQAILKADEQFNIDESFELPPFNPELSKQLQDFRFQINKINFHVLQSMGQRDSLVEEQQYFDPNDDKHSDKDKEINNFSDEEQLQFQDLGIIELDDQEWGEEQNEVQITQKLPLKKVYKLSPNLSSSTKLHRLRNKRLDPNQFEEDKIIVDELEGKISMRPQNLETKPQPKIEDIIEPEEINSGVVYEQIERQNSQNQLLVTSEQRAPKKQKKVGKKRKSSTLK